MPEGRRARCGAIKLNDRPRSTITTDLEPGEQIEAVVPRSLNVGAAGSSVDGTHCQAGTVLGHPYAAALGLDLDNPALHGDLVNCWLTVTDRRLLFHRPKQTAVRPTPGELVDAMSREGVQLRWFDTGGFSMTSRVVHLELADGRHVLGAVGVKARLRRKPYNDEPFLLVAAFGDPEPEPEEAG
jgi:hypothetical protein